MKFYVYIADAKVDSLLAAVPQGDREQLARELDLDPVLLSPLELPRGAPDEMRFARVAVLERHLAATGQSGGLDAETPFIVDQRELRWGRLRHMRGDELVRHETESPVAFALIGDAPELIAIGSASQLLAQPPKATVDDGAQLDTAEREWFAPSSATAELDPMDRRSLERVFEDAPPPAPRVEPMDWSSEVTKCEPWMERLGRVRRELRVLPAQRLEMLVKRLATFSAGRFDPATQRVQPGAPLILATPVYVAMVV